MNARAQSLIDETDWGAVSHAYGPADDLMLLFEALVSGAAKTREKARYELYGNVWHQGTVYSASAPAARVLLALVEDQTTPGRAEIVALLQCIATGASYHQVHRGVRLKSSRSQDEMDDVVATERGWVAQAHAAVREGLPILVRCLDEEHADVREAASLALSAFPEDVDVIGPALLRRLEVELPGKARLGLVLAVGKLCRGDAAMADIVRRSLHATGAERVYAAISLAGMLGPASRREVEAILSEVCESGNAWEDEVESTFWNAETHFEARVEEALEQIRA